MGVRGRRPARVTAGAGTVPPLPRPRLVLVTPALFLVDGLPVGVVRSPGARPVGVGLLPAAGVAQATVPAPRVILLAPAGRPFQGALTAIPGPVTGVGRLVPPSPVDFSLSFTGQTWALAQTVP